MVNHNYLSTHQNNFTAVTSQGSFVCVCVCVCACVCYKVIQGPNVPTKIVKPEIWGFFFKLKIVNDVYLKV